jgi:nucleotide-binding universal stress UspA family protein
MEIRKIVVPVDFSTHSRRALDEAVVFAKAFGAELHLLHCYQLLPEVLELYGVETPQSFEHDVFEAAQKRMEEWCASVRAQGVDVHPHLGSYVPSKETVALAERLDAGLIAMGTKGLSGLKHVLLGSVAERVVRLAPCPVLTVSGERAQHAIGKILVAVDFSEHAQRAFDDAIALAKTFGAQLHLLHCYQIDPVSVSPYGIVIPETLEHDIRMAALHRLSEWREKAASQGVRVQEHITAHFPSQEIVAISDRLGIDLVVMGTHGRTGFKHMLLGSVAERTIRNAKCPVLTVKKNA